MNIHPSQTVGQIAVTFKEAIPVFEKYKIDYVNQGSRSLKDACYMAGIPLEKVLEELEESPPPKEEWYASEPDWRNEPMAELTDHIIKTHHVFTRLQLEKIEELLDNLMLPGPAPVEVVRVIHGFFHNMAQDLRAHMQEEEEVVFPYLVEVEMAIQGGKPIPWRFQDYNALTHPIRILQADHGMMGREWMKLEELTGDFTPPPNASQDLKDLYQAFKELDQDNRKHFHLENNILFHRAMQLGLLNGGERNENHNQKTHTL
jgi:regulator of cell morphogenesis and NO signaling